MRHQVNAGRIDAEWRHEGRSAMRTHRTNLASAGSLLAVVAAMVFNANVTYAVPIEFVFANLTEFDGAGPDTTMTRNDGLGAEVTMTLEAALDASAMAAVIQIHTSSGITFETDDTATFVFDEPVTIDYIDFSSVATSGDTGRITIGMMTPWEFGYGDLTGGSANEIFDPFNGLVIPAGTTFKVDGVAGSWRMVELHVTPVPEPSSIVISSMAFTGLLALGRRKLANNS